MVSKKANNNTKCATRYEIAQKVENYMPMRGYTQKDLASKIGVSFRKMQRCAHTNNIIK
ncbi:MULTISPECIES: hypothetical protein [unclassified Wolbachia]|uniref:hypothetical protein n=1 Tax=unclassified Wolbachia TaxID=2640676 RepID=UPI0033420D87